MNERGAGFPHVKNMDEIEAITSPLEDDHGIVEEESSLFTQLVPKDEGELVDEIEESEDSAERMQLIRYDPLRHYLLETESYPRTQ